jgi:hypothetical protein
MGLSGAFTIEPNNATNGQSQPAAPDANERSRQILFS